MRPTIPAAAPNPQAAPASSASATAGPPLTLTGATYGPDAAGFGQQLTGGSGTAQLTMPAGAFTYEFWFTAASRPSADTLLVGLPTFPKGVFITPDGNFKFFDNSNATVYQNGPTVTDGARHHVAVSSDAPGSGNIVRVYVDGAQAATAGATGIAANPGLSIGGFGAIDEVRVSSVARYTANFAPPTAPFTPDGSTVALFHLDGNGGSS